MFKSMTLVHRIDLTGKRWLQFENGRRLDDELADSVLKAIPKGEVTKDRQRFQIIPKSQRGYASARDPIPTVTWTPGKVDMVDVDMKLMPDEVTPPAIPQTLAEWQSLLQRLEPGWTQKESIQDLIGCISHAEVFEFGEVDERRLYQENHRALELHNKGFLHLPYKCVVFRYTGSRRGAIAAREPGAAVLVGGDLAKGEHLLWPLALMLATKGTRVRVEEPSHKLQAKRAAHGKPRLPRVTYVDAEAYHQAMRNTEAKGHHASPVPHLRRGHIRHWKDRDIWIKDMLVNCKSIDEIDHRARYEVKGVK